MAKLTIGELLLTNKENIYAYAAKLPTGQKYDFMAKDEPIWILNSDNCTPDPDVKLHAYVGDALNAPEQKIMKMWAKIYSYVGTYTGRTEIVSGVVFHQVEGSLYVYNPYVNQDSFLKNALYWVKASEVLGENEYKERALTNAEMEKQKNQANTDNPEAPNNQKGIGGSGTGGSGDSNGSGQSSKTGLIIGIALLVVGVGVAVWAFLRGRKEEA